MATNHLLEIKQYGQSIWMDSLTRDIKIDLDAVVDELLIEGIDKFIQPFQSLMNSLEEKIKVLSPV